MALNRTKRDFRRVAWKGLYTPRASVWPAIRAF